MKVTTTIGMAIEAKNTLETWMTHEFPAKQARDVSRVLNRLKSNVDIMATDDVRVKLVFKYGTRNDNGMTSVSQASMVDFVREYSPLAEEPIELEVPGLPEDILDYAPATKPLAIAALEPFWAIQQQKENKHDDAVSSNSPQV